VRTANRFVPVLLLGAAAMLAYAPFLILATPMESTMGLVQKIFYFHVPAAMMLFLAAFLCGGGSAMYLWRRTNMSDHVALAGAELAVVYGLIVLVTGPLWARKAWGVWWVWDVRLTTTLVMWMIFVGYLLLRRFGGPGSELLASAVGLFGTVLVPFIYVSVNYWNTQHPQTTVVPTLPRPMAGPLWWCVAAFFLFFCAVLIVRIRLAESRAAIEEAYVALED